MDGLLKKIQKFDVEKLKDVVGNVKNAVMNLSEYELKVREATNNDPCKSSSSFLLQKKTHPYSEEFSFLNWLIFGNRGSEFDFNERNRCWHKQLPALPCHCRNNLQKIRNDRNKLASSIQGNPRFSCFIFTWTFSLIWTWREGAKY